MKRYRVIGMVMVLSVSSVSTFAQVRITPGVMTGIGIFDESMSISGASTSASPSNVGFVAGGFLDIALSQNVSLRPGLVFSSRGGSYTDSGGYSENHNLNYLAIPVDLKLSYRATPQICPYVLLGMNLGILLSATDHISIPGEVSGDIDYGSLYNPVDFGFDLGAGAEFPGFDVIPFVELSFYLGVATTNNNNSF